MITFVIPTKFEAEDLLASLADRSRADVEDVECYLGRVKEVSVQVILCGIGPRRAAESVTKAFAVRPPSLVIVAGFAGGLSTQLERGQILVAAGYSSGDLINYLKLIPGFDIGRFAFCGQGGGHGGGETGSGRKDRMPDGGYGDPGSQPGDAGLWSGGLGDPDHQ
ncbi:MAG: hypothetical protein HC904_01805 [Blastochloris sp.]|nr:hypothetical protein [Blastochloris sp.]